MPGASGEMGLGAGRAQGTYRCPWESAAAQTAPHSSETGGAPTWTPPRPSSSPAVRG